MKRPAPFFTSTLVASLTLASLTLGCASARMSVPPGLASASAWKVEGRQGWKFKEELSFGPYQAKDVRRSWTRGSDFQLNPDESSHRKQTFSFTLTEGGKELLHGSFIVTLQRRALDVGIDIELQNRSLMEGHLTTPNSPSSAGATVHLEETGASPFAGTVNGETTPIRVTGTDRLEGSPFPLDVPTGYTLAAEGRDVATVEVIGDGSVRFADGMDPRLRPILAATAAALLLVEELRSTLPE